MKTYQILYRQRGENATTPHDPYAVWNHQVNLDEEIVCCRSWDDDGLTTKKKYSVCEVELPDWLSPDEWLQNEVHWEFAWSYCGKDASESLQRWFAYGELGEARKTAVMKLLETKNFKSDFRKSLYEQITQWLNTPVDERKYQSPLSAKQWGALVTRFDYPRNDSRRWA